MTDTVLVAIITAVPTTIGAVAAVCAFIAARKGNRKLDDVGEKINGRLSRLLEAVSAEQQAIGRAEGVEAGRAEGIESERVREGK